MLIVKVSDKCDLFQFLLYHPYFALVLGEGFEYFMLFWVFILYDGSNAWALFVMLSALVTKIVHEDFFSLENQIVKS